MNILFCNVAKFHLIEYIILWLGECINYGISNETDLSAVAKFQ